MPFILPTLLSFQGSTHLFGVGSFSNIIIGEYSSDIVSSRVLEDDNITIMGLSAGLLTYQSTMGGEITIPSMLIEKIDQ